MTGARSEDDQAHARSAHHRFGAARSAQFAEDGIHVEFCRVLADVQARCDLAIRPTARHELKNFDLAWRQRFEW